MKVKPVLDWQDAEETMDGVFDSHSSNNAVDLIPFGQEKFSQVGTILSGNT
jgi:D-lyxose ketol-isomerase